MATTIKGLKTAFKKANRRVDKAFARYKKALAPLYVPYGGEIVSAESLCFSEGGYYTDGQGVTRWYEGSLLDFATELSWTFYRRGRGGKFYEKERYAGREWDAYKRAYQPVGQDYLDLLKLEREIDASADEREEILARLAHMGYDVQADAELQK